MLFFRPLQCCKWCWDASSLLAQKCQLTLKKKDWRRGMLVLFGSTDICKQTLTDPDPLSGKIACQLPFTSEHLTHSHWLYCTCSSPAQNGFLLLCPRKKLKNSKWNKQNSKSTYYLFVLFVWVQSMQRSSLVLYEHVSECNQHTN